MTADRFPHSKIVFRSEAGAEPSQFIFDLLGDTRPKIATGTWDQNLGMTLQLAGLACLFYGKLY